MLVKGGRSDHVIVVAPKPAALVMKVRAGKSGYPTNVFPSAEPRTVLHCAGELQRVIFEASGAKLPVVSDGGPLPRGVRPIFVGDSPAARKRGVSPEGLAPEGYRLAAGPGWAAIVGEVSVDGTDRGTIFGVYDFLERVVGARWYFPGELGTVIPRRADVPMPAFRATVEPAFNMRLDGGLGQASWLDWLPALRHGGTGLLFVNHTMNSWGGHFGASHPEYFAVQADGSRRISNGYANRDNHVCYSRPEVLAQEIGNQERWFAEGKRVWENAAMAPNETYSYFCPHDVMSMFGVCHCRDCMAAWRPEDPSGQYSELIFGYAARLAGEMRKRWPGRRLAAAAYEAYEHAPRNVAIPDNLDVMLCQVRGPVMQTDPAVYENERQALDAWFRLLGGDRNRLAVWHYFCYPNMFTNAPLLPARTLARWHRENRGKVSGMFNNGMGWRQSPGSELNYYMIWLWHRLLWNPEADPDALTEDFCRNLFGPAAGPMLALFTLETDRMEKTRWSRPALGAYIPERVVYGDIYPPEVVARLKGFFAEAKRLAPAGGVHLKRVEWYESLHAPFFEESALFARWDRVLPVAAVPKTAGGEGWWRDVEPRTLVEQIFGKSPRAGTRVFLGHTEESMLLHAEMDDPGVAGLAAAGTADQDRRIRDDDSLQICFDLDGRAYWHSIRFNGAGRCLTGIESPDVYIREKHLSGLSAEWNPPARPAARARREADRWILDAEIPFAAFAAWNIGRDLYGRGLRMQVRRFKKTVPAERTALCPILQQDWEFPLTRFVPVVFER